MEGKKEKEPILDIVQQFITYFEEVDKEDNNGNSSTSDTSI